MRSTCHRVFGSATVGREWGATFSGEPLFLQSMRVFLSRESFPLLSFFVVPLLLCLRRVVRSVALVGRASFVHPRPCAVRICAVSCCVLCRGVSDDGCRRRLLSAGCGGTEEEADEAAGGERKKQQRQTAMTACDHTQTPNLPPPPMPLSSLRTVELQLCMQLLDQPSLLKFARCNRNTLAAASSPCVWLHQVATICTVQLELERFSSSLLRFARGVHLRWLSPDLASPTRPLTPPTRWLLPSLPLPIVGLEVRGWSGVQWAATLMSPRFSQMRVLRFEIAGKHTAVGPALPFLPLESLWFDGWSTRTW